MSDTSKFSSRRGQRRSTSKSFSRLSTRKSRSQKTDKKLSFWQKIVAFFRGENSKEKKQTSSSTKSDALRGSPAKREPVAMRNPELCEVTSPRLYVGNLPYAATESDLFELFKGVGIVKNVEIIWDKRNQSRGFGFVEMQSLEEAKRAVEQLHDKEYMGRKLVVSGAKALAEDRASQRKAGRTPSAPAETPAPSATGEIPETAQAQPTSPSAPPSQTTSSPSESSEAEPRRSAA